MVDYDDGDKEEYDFQDLADILIMGTKYGDLGVDDGKTRAEKLAEVRNISDDGKGIFSQMESTIGR